MHIKTILSILILLMVTCSRTEEGMFFNSWPYNKAAKNTKNEDWKEKEVSNPFLVDTPSSKSNSNNKASASNPAPVFNQNTISQSQSQQTQQSNNNWQVPNNHNLNFPNINNFQQIQQTNQNQPWGLSQNVRNPSINQYQNNAGAQEESKVKDIYLKSVNTNNANFGNTNTNLRSNTMNEQSQNNQRNSAGVNVKNKGSDQIHFGDSNNNGRGSNNRYGNNNHHSGFRNNGNNNNGGLNNQRNPYPIITTPTTTSTTTTTPAPTTKKAGNDNMFFNSWPYNTNNRKGNHETMNGIKKDEPNSFLVENPKQISHNNRIDQNPPAAPAVHIVPVAPAPKQDNQFYNSWPYITNKRQDEENLKKKNQPNPFLVESPTNFNAPQTKENQIVEDRRKQINIDQNPPEAPKQDNQFYNSLPYITNKRQEDEKKKNEPNSFLVESPTNFNAPQTKDNQIVEDRPKQINIDLNPPEAPKQDNQFYNSWPYITNKRQEDENSKMKNEPNPFLVEDSNEPSNQEISISSNVSPQVLDSNPLWNHPEPKELPAVENFKTKWQLEEEEEQLRQNAKLVSTYNRDPIIQANPSNYLRREDLERDDYIEKVPEKFYENKLNKVDDNFHFIEPEKKLNAAAHFSKNLNLQSNNIEENTDFQDPPSTIQRAKNWFLGVSNGSKSSIFYQKEKWFYFISYCVPHLIIYKTLQ